MHGYDSKFRIMTSIGDLEASDFFTMETRGHGKKIMKQSSRLNLRKSSFSHRVVDDWNSLQSKVVEARDVEQSTQNWISVERHPVFAHCPISLIYLAKVTCKQ